MERKVMLANALVNAQKEAEMYEGMAKRARETEREIKAELDSGYQPAGFNYTAEQIRTCRMRVLGETNGAGWMAPRDIVFHIQEFDADLIVRELHKLAHNPRSDMVWNNRKGPASRYGRFPQGRTM